MLDQRQWLRIVHHNKVVIEKVAQAVLVDHLLENLFFDFGEIDFCALESIVHLLRDQEKIRCALNHSPFSAQSEAIHEKGERRNRLGHAAAVVVGIKIRDAQAFEFDSLVANSLYDFRSDERFIIFDLSDAIMGHHE